VNGREISWTQAYEGRMPRFNLEVLLVALIALALLITWLFSTWEAFQKSLMMFPVVQLLPLTGVFTARIFLRELHCSLPYWEGDADSIQGRVF
jgi:hypothetical protein